MDGCKFQNGEVETGFVNGDETMRLGKRERDECVRCSLTATNKLNSLDSHPYIFLQLEANGTETRTDFACFPEETSLASCIKKKKALVESDAVQRNKTEYVQDFLVLRWDG